MKFGYISIICSIWFYKCISQISNKVCVQNTLVSCIPALISIQVIFKHKKFYNFCSLFWNSVLFLLSVLFILSLKIQLYTHMKSWKGSRAQVHIATRSVIYHSKIFCDPPVSRDPYFGKRWYRLLYIDGSSIIYRLLK